MRRRVAVTINGAKHEHEVEPRLLLVQYIRELAGLTGTHVGCDTSNCGACTVELDGHSVKSCTIFAVQADGARSEEHTSELQSRLHLVCRLLLEKKKRKVCLCSHSIKAATRQYRS